MPKNDKFDLKKEFINNIEFTRSEISLMYSGGLDTTMAAFILAQQFRQVHLLTFCNGLCMRVERSSVHVQALKQKFGNEKFVHRVIYVADLFVQLRRGLWQYFRRYKSPLVFDLCCRLSMEAATVIYCLENNIRYAADSNNAAQDAIFLQQQQYLNIVDDFFNHYGIRMLHPVYYRESRVKRRDNLKLLGLNGGYKFLERIGITSQLFNQPFCLWAPISFFFTSYLRHLPLIKKYTLSLENAIDFRLNREEIARDYIQKYLNARQLEIDKTDEDNATKYTEKI